MQLPVRALFRKPVSGDDALLRLARLRFDQEGLGAELYADDGDLLEHELAFAPAAPLLPTVHLNRRLDLRSADDRAVVAGFVRRFAGRVAGFVVHVQAGMERQTAELVAGIADLDREIAGLGPIVFLEYAREPGVAWFGELAGHIAGAGAVSLCIDIGHVGVHVARDTFARAHPDVEIADLLGDAERLQALVDDVEAATAAALPAVTELIRIVARVGKPVHMHVHDAHPLIPGLSDHFSFLMRVAVPFAHRGRASLDPMFGPEGLCEIVAAVDQAATVAAPSLMLEIHQSEGRRPLGDAAELFTGWSDLTNAERANHWFAVLAENARLLTTLC